ncbi:CHRD domain-containing protein [Roseivirga sp. BDSF3-8]|uniref:CHRD domain-containing protein n=1 Tax=Roseivirga sp. BDSF3-8 TaxID=3241598 RepID=UPI003531A6DE
MKKNLYQLSYWTKYLGIFLILPFVFASCDDDDDGNVNPDDGLTGEVVIYNLDERNGSGVSGTATFAERNDGSAIITLDLDGTSAGNSHPAHIHMNTAAETGAIVISLDAVNGDDGMSVTEVDETDDGTDISYEELIVYDGYINVHLSASDLTVVAQGDIGENALTGVSETYPLDERNGSGVSGEVTFSERLDGTALVTIDVEGTPVDGDHPAHIHTNTAAETGAIVVSLNNVNGGTGMSYTTVEEFDDGTALTYAELVDYEGYVNVHLSANDLTVVSQGDIGANALTGESTVYELGERNSSQVNGTATFYERENGNTLIVLDVENTPADGDHPAHIHAQSAEETGPIVLSLNNVDGATGMSMTSAGELDDGTPVTYTDLTSYDGYINIHLSPSNLMVVSQGNIGLNAPTGETMTYNFTAQNGSGVDGTVTIYERVDGHAIVVLDMNNTPAGGDHPAHIHANSAAETGPIVISLNNVNGDTGNSATAVIEFDDGTPVFYSDLLNYDGYINVHLSPSDLTVVSQTNIGSNAN